MADRIDAWCYSVNKDFDVHDDLKNRADYYLHRAFTQVKDVENASIIGMAWCLRHIDGSGQFDFAKLQIYLEENNIDITLEPDERPVTDCAVVSGTSRSKTMPGIQKYRPGKKDTKYHAVYHVGPKEYRQPHIERINRKFSRQGYLYALSESGILAVGDSSDDKKSWKEMANEQIQKLSTGELRYDSVWKFYEEDISAFDSVEITQIKNKKDNRPLFATVISGTTPKKSASSFGYIIENGKKKPVVLKDYI
jgi:hypothetical protein